MAGLEIDIDAVYSTEGTRGQRTCTARQPLDSAGSLNPDEESSGSNASTATTVNTNIQPASVLSNAPFHSSVDWQDSSWSFSTLKPIESLDSTNASANRSRRRTWSVGSSDKGNNGPPTLSKGGGASKLMFSPSESGGLSPTEEADSHNSSSESEINGIRDTFEETPILSVLKSENTTVCTSESDPLSIDPTNINLSNPVSIGSFHTGGVMSAVRQRDLNRLPSALRHEASQVLNRWRKVVTGTETKRIRDHFREKQDQPSTTKWMDKIAFTLGVLNILVCQYFLLSMPRYFKAWYSIVVPILLTSRFYHFRSLNWHYFMIDFCYFTIALTLINLFVVTSSPRLFKLCFIYSTGVLPMAIPVWRNSLIFHDYDKIVSVYIHILPCMLYYTLRWPTTEWIAAHYPESLVSLASTASQLATSWYGDASPPPGAFGVCESLTASASAALEKCPSDFSFCQPLDGWDYLIALTMYVLWQTTYILKTEILDREWFDAHPELLTSLRWLAKDTKNAFARLLLRGLRRINVFDELEDFNPTSLKTKMVFVGSQLIFTTLCCIPTIFLYNSRALLLSYIVLLFVIAVFNGASFYIEVFSVRYHRHIQELEEMTHIAREAQAVAHEIAKHADAAAALSPRVTMEKIAVTSTDKSLFSRRGSVTVTDGEGETLDFRLDSHDESPLIRSEEDAIAWRELSSNLAATSKEALLRMHEQYTTYPYHHITSPTELEASRLCTPAKFTHDGTDLDLDLYLEEDDNHPFITSD